MKVSELGEFGLIDLLAKTVRSTPDKDLIIGIGDDAAAWQTEASTQLATVDSFIQDIHFSLDTTSWYELGWKALAVNLSDIAAMGGIPRYALISLAIPGHTEVEDITVLYKGMAELARRFEVTMVGGDTSKAPLVAIAVSVLGNASYRDRPVLTRSTARVGDRVAVTGYLGAASAGWEMLANKLQFDTENTASLKKAFLQPEPRVTEGQLLVKNGVKTAIDISDGLISDLTHICEASRVGAIIEVERVPVHHAVRANFGDRALELALSGGEDYELLFTGTDGEIAQIKEAAPFPVTVIGEITSDKINKVTLLDGQGNPFQLGKKGWEHFI